MPQPDPDPDRTAADAAGPRPRPRRDLWPALALAAAAAALFAAGVSSEPAFVDESAYLSQSYFAGLFAAGSRDDPLWLDYPAYDLPPLPKYLIGGALALGGHRAPGPAEARAWYGDTSRRFDGPGALYAARLPSVFVGALGCAAVYGLGALAAGRGTGALAAVLLAVNPLYKLHARRAMSDVPCEAFMLLGLFAALWVWRRSLSGRLGVGGAVAALAAGACFGLSVSSKFSGALGPMVVAAWGALAVVTGAPFARVARFVGAGAVMGLVAAAVFVGLNPFLTAKPAGKLTPDAARMAAEAPWQRLVLMYRLRLDVSDSQKTMFAHNALNTPAEKVAATVVQGFGRFGPFGPSHSDSTVRFDRSQDLGGLVWLPWVALGGAWAWSRGRAQRRAGLPPTAWAVLTQFVVSAVVVTAYVPMAWDRYFLALQAPAALLASGAALAALGGLAGRSRRPAGTGTGE